MNKNKKTAYGLAIFLILLGLLIGFLGGYASYGIKHYYGILNINDERVEVLSSMYPITEAAPGDNDTFYYNFFHYSIIEPSLSLGLEFTYGPPFYQWAWNSICAVLSIGYIILGILAFSDKGILFIKPETKRRND